MSTAIGNHSRRLLQNNELRTQHAYAKALACSERDVKVVYFCRSCVSTQWVNVKLFSLSPPNCPCSYTTWKAVFNTNMDNSTFSIIWCASAIKIRLKILTYQFYNWRLRIRRRALNLSKQATINDLRGGRIGRLYIPFESVIYDNLDETVLHGKLT